MESINHSSTKQQFIPKLWSVLQEGYSLSSLRKDLIAGIIVGILSIPLSIAFAIASGASPSQGLLTAVIAGAIASATSGSMFQITGPTGAFVILVYSTIAQYGYEGMLAATLIAGILLIVAGSLKAGVAIKFIPYSVTVGFTSGIAVRIATSQIPDFLGLSLPSGGHGFVHQWSTIFTHLSTVSVWTCLIGFGSLLIVWFWPRAKIPVPGSLIAIVLTTLLVYAFEIPCKTIGEKFPDLSFVWPSVALPAFQWKQLPDLIQPAIAIALLAGIESLLSAVVSDGMSGRRHRSNMELISQGLANISSSLTGGLPATGAISRTATNIKSGAVSPFAGIFQAGVILFFLMFLSPLLAYIPLSTLAATLLVIAYNMGEWHHFLTIFRCPKSDILILLTTFLLTVLVDLVVAIEVGMILAAFIALNRLAEASGLRELSDSIDQEEDPQEIEKLRALEIPPEIQVFEIYGSLFFAAMEKFMLVQGRLKSRPKIMILRMRHVLTIDASGIRLLMDFIDQARRSQTVLIMSGIKEHSPLYKLLVKAQVIPQIGEDHLFASFTQAVKYSKEFLEKSMHEEGRR